MRARARARVCVCARSRARARVRVRSGSAYLIMSFTDATNSSIWAIMARAMVLDCGFDELRASSEGRVSESASFERSSLCLA